MSVSPGETDALQGRWIGLLTKLKNAAPSSTLMEQTQDLYGPWAAFYAKWKGKTILAPADVATFLHHHAVVGQLENAAKTLLASSAEVPDVMATSPTLASLLSSTASISAQQIEVLNEKYIKLLDLLSKASDPSLTAQFSEFYAAKWVPFYKKYRDVGAPAKETEIFDLLEEKYKFFRAKADALVGPLVAPWGASLLPPDEHPPAQSDGVVVLDPPSSSPAWASVLGILAVAGLAWLALGGRR